MPTTGRHSIRGYDAKFKLTYCPCSLFFRKNYAMLGAVFAGAFAFELFVHPSARSNQKEEANTPYSSYNSITNSVFDSINRGVRIPSTHASLSTGTRVVLTECTATMEGHPTQVR